MSFARSEDKHGQEELRKRSLPEGQSLSMDKTRKRDEMKQQQGRFSTLHATHL